MMNRPISNFNGICWIKYSNMPFEMETLNMQSYGQSSQIVQISPDDDK